MPAPTELTRLSKTLSVPPKKKTQPAVRKPATQKPTNKTLKPKVAQAATAKPEPAVKNEKSDEDSLFVGSASSSTLAPNTKPVGPPPPPPDNETAVTLALNALEDDCIRVVRKEKCAAMGLAAVAQLKVLLLQSVKSHLTEHCDEILSLGKLPRILIGVLGHTGAGKSSLINALVEQETIVPCNAMRASTSVVVEIAYNESKDPQSAFRAEVEFVTNDEWTDEFDILSSDIKNRSASEQLTMNSTTDAGLAFAKLSAVYPGVPISKVVHMTPAELNRRYDLTEFSEAVNVYIDSSNKGTDADEFVYWPLVRLVKVYIKSEILKNGLVLVDLPGLGDSNVGRTKVAEGYIKKLRHMWVVADIVRAIDDKVANELMSTSFKRRLLMDGRYHENFVTFIMTKTDQITTHEVIQSLGLDTTVLEEDVVTEARLTTELDELKKQLSEQKHQQKQCKRSLKKLGDMCSPSMPNARQRSFEEADTEAELSQVSEERSQLVTDLNAAIAAETELNGKISRVKKSISTLNTQMKAACIKERNRYTQRALERDFEIGQGELLEELEAGGNEMSYSAPQGNSKKSLNTFCVSAKAYQKLQGRFRRDNTVKGFLSIDDTNIPSLQEFAEECTLADREFAADKVLTELNLLKVTLQLWAENRGTTAQLTVEQREALKMEVEKHFKVMKDVKHNQVPNQHHGQHSHLQEQDIGARHWSKDKDLAYQTWKAICTRKGEKYHAGKKVEHYWNEEFLQLFLEPLAKPWNHVFQKKIELQNRNYAVQTIQSLRDFQKAIHLSVTAICGKYALAHNALKQVPILEDQIQGRVKEALQAGQASAQDAHRAIGETVKKLMTPYYVESDQVKGKGALARLKQLLRDFAKDKAQPMYHEASETLGKELDNMRGVLSKEIAAAARQAQAKLKKDILSVISQGRFDEKAAKSVATAELRSQAKNGLLALEEAWASELVNPSTDLRARDAFAGSAQDPDASDDESDHPEVSDGLSDSSLSEEDNDDSDDEDYEG
ncbi:uncharacterized protein LY89DRAFT_781452 [Mollisia scopiformis]|uniref:Nuclear GTPase SLIP-GC n=1 Tax=Mollisia scopiformis TaxID=149040 RepID=A0A194XE18_MOLSC|nr:uncharacterized protein LY89DRAFT_781452 [Mollisia scopiformis]KUJ18396.1 hypothetical protein LY89DRAFT_781452 [Mollisia scopiformis]